MRTSTAWVDVASGAIAGFVATIPMTIVMDVLHRRLPNEEWRALPPRQIVARAVRRTGLRRHVDRGDELALTWLSHLGFGASAGALWGALSRRLPLDSQAGGIAYGVSVWATSYLGWLPAVGLMPPTTRQSSGRNALMIAAHVVWGGTLAAVGAVARRGIEEAISRGPIGSAGGLTSHGRSNDGRSEEEGHGSHGSRA